MLVLLGEQGQSERDWVMNKFFRYGEEPKDFKGFKESDEGTLVYEFYYFTKQVSMIAEVINGEIHCYWSSSKEYKKAQQSGYCYGKFDNVNIRHSINKRKYQELSEDVK
jgi:hypothetical protein